MSVKEIDAKPAARELAKAVLIIADGHARIGEVMIKYVHHAEQLEVIEVRVGSHKRVVFSRCANWALIDNHEDYLAALSIKLGEPSMRFGQTICRVKNRHVPPVLTPAVEQPSSSGLWLAVPLLALAGIAAVVTKLRK